MREDLDEHRLNFKVWQDVWPQDLSSMKGEGVNGYDISFQPMPPVGHSNPYGMCP